MISKVTTISGNCLKKKPTCFPFLLKLYLNGAIHEGEYDEDFNNLWNVHLSQKKYMLKNKETLKHAQCRTP